ncbi:MAG: hypothetical protein NTZ49_03835 [Candidatus Parcubacteria bacterium]|nr:hypothetical protein [Candidatus Parcubacteria bacterium]
MTKGKTYQQVIDEMCEKLHSAGFHTNNYVSIGQWDAYHLVDKETMISCILFRVIGKLNFMLMDYTEESLNQLMQFMSSELGVAVFLKVGDKTPLQMKQAIEADLPSKGFPPDSTLRKLGCVFGIFNDVDGVDPALMIDVGAYLRYVLIGADFDYVIDLIAEIKK